MGKLKSCKHTYVDRTQLTIIFMEEDNCSMPIIETITRCEKCGEASLISFRLPTVTECRKAQSALNKILQPDKRRK